MDNALCRMTGADFPLFAFSHCRDVVVAVSKAGGFGVFGAAAYTPEQFEQELAWIDAHIDGKPYGVDVLVPETVDPRVTAFTSNAQRAAAISPEYKAFTADLLARYGVKVPPEDSLRVREGAGITPENGQKLMEVAFRHPIKLIANALGIAPPEMIAEGKKRGIPVAALVGAKEHALRQAAAGVDIIVAQGGEAGGHTGEIGSMVLIPEVVDAVAPVPVLGAGGIGRGRQMAAAMALGAQGVWCGSVWLTTEEAETHPAVKEKMLRATSADTIRSRSRTGKPARMLKSAWTEEWDDPTHPQPLGMPLQPILTAKAIQRIDRAAVKPGSGAEKLANYFVGQIVGHMNESKTSAQVVYEMVDEFIDAIRSVQTQMDA